MKNLFVIQTSLKHLLYNWKSSFVITVSLTISFVAVLLLTENLLYSSSYIENMQLHKRTYNLNMTAESSSIDLIQELLYGNELPEIEYIDSVRSHPVTNENVEYYTAPVVFIDNSSRYKPKIDIVDGRFFTEDELNTGENVIILSNYSTVYFRQNISVGDFLIINNKEYEVIGINNGDSYISFANAQNGNFHLTVSVVRFSEILTQAEEADFLNKAGISGASPQTWWDSEKGDFIIRTIVYIVIILLVMYCAMSIISQLFAYMISSRIYEFNIYRLLGIQEKTLLSLFYFPLIIISIITFIFGLGIYFSTSELQKHIGLENILETKIILFIMACMMIILSVTTFPMYLNLKKSNVSESR